MANEQYIMRLYALQQEAEKYEEQLNLANQQIQELESLSLSLKKITENKDILAPIGRGIYVESEVKSKELFVNIGSNIIVKKTPNQAIEIISNQINKIEEIKNGLMNEMNELNNQMRDLLEEAQKAESQ